MNGVIVSRLNIVVRTLQCGDQITGFDFNATSDEVVPGAVFKTMHDFDPMGFTGFDLTQIERFLDDMYGNARVKIYRISLNRNGCDMSHRRRIITALQTANQLPARELCFWESFRIMDDSGNEVVTQPVTVSRMSAQR